MDTIATRRGFMAAATGAAAGTFAGAEAEAAGGARPTTELLRVGVVAVGNGSHMNYSIWAPTINPEEPDSWPIRSTRMLITHCWEIGRAHV